MSSTTSLEWSDMLRRLVCIVTVLLYACNETPASHVKPTTEAKPDAPIARPRSTVARSWPTSTDPAQAARALAGPYASLDQFCALLDVPSNFECGAAESLIPIQVRSPFQELGFAGLVPRERQQAATPHPDPLYIGLRTEAGWYFMPSLYPTAEHEVFLINGGDMHRGRLMLNYRHMFATADDRDVRGDDGLIVCGIDKLQAVYCTGGITTSWFDARRDSICAWEMLDGDHLVLRDPKGTTTASKKSGKGKKTAAAPGSSDAAGGGAEISHLPCKSSPYFGDHVIEFPS